MDQKERRERDFHDKAFAESTRESAWKFYAVTIDSRGRYERLVTELAAGRVALDYGCGRGANSRLLAKVARTVVAIDISDVALHQTREHLMATGRPAVQFSAMNAESLAIADGAFDLVCGKAVIHHLDLPRALGELARILKPGGSAVFLEPLGHNPFINAYRRLTPRMRTADEHPLTTQDFALASQYFANVQVEYFTLLPLLAVPLRGTALFTGAVKVLSRVDQTLFRALPPLSRYAWQVVVRLSGPKPPLTARPSVHGR